MIARDNKMAENEKKNKLTYIAIILTILFCTIPMRLSPVWNGAIENHHSQYEDITESFLKGKLYFEYAVDEKLLTLKNPYDPVERDASGAKYHWDCSFYNGRYYMYFGVVPVLLVFLPYRLITGHSLVGYHATQVFTALFIVGIFALFRLLSILFYEKLSSWNRGEE